MICVDLIIIFRRRLISSVGARLNAQRPMTAAPGTAANGAGQRSDRAP